MDSILNSLSLCMRLELSAKGEAGKENVARIN
jgi:hypothetical protein